MDVLLKFSGSPDSGLLGAAVICLWVLGLVIHVAFALAVLANARGRDTTFVGPGMWCLATLLGGPLVALAYWLINVSSLAAGPRK